MALSGTRVKVAAVQVAPVVLDREAILDKLERLVAEAADLGARIIVLPEAFVPAYPASPVFGPVFGGFSDPAAGPVFRRFAENAAAAPSWRRTAPTWPSPSMAVKGSRPPISTSGSSPRVASFST